MRKVTAGELPTAVDAQELLEARLGITVNANTVQRALKKEGLVARTKVKKPLLSKRHRQLRLSFAQKYKEWTIEDWERVIWTDETKVNRWV